MLNRNMDIAAQTLVDHLNKMFVAIRNNNLLAPTAEGYTESTPKEINLFLQETLLQAGYPYIACQFFKELHQQGLFNHLFPELTAIYATEQGQAELEAIIHYVFLQINQGTLLRNKHALRALYDQLISLTGTSDPVPVIINNTLFAEFYPEVVEAYTKQQLAGTQRQAYEEEKPQANEQIDMPGYYLTATDVGNSGVWNPQPIQNLESMYLQAMYFFQQQAQQQVQQQLLAQQLLQWHSYQQHLQESTSVPPATRPTLTQQAQPAISINAGNDNTPSAIIINNKPARHSTLFKPKNLSEQKRNNQNKATKHTNLKPTTPKH